LSGVVERYTGALAGAAEDRGVLDQVAEDAEGLAELLGSSEELRGFVDDPFALPAQKQAVFEGLLDGKVHEVTLSFLHLLCEKRRERSLEQILTAFANLMNEKRGIVTASVSSAQALTDSQRDQLTERLEKFSGKQVRLETEIDPNLKAGFIARLGDQVFDGTVESMLNRLHRELRTGS
jgi:F-type H+-transporting ATPase subunit delta